MKIKKCFKTLLLSDRAIRRLSAREWKANVPNPFAEQTTISYFIPEEQAGTAQILFFDHSGKAVKTVDVQKGRGILTVFAPNLSSGTYSYTLIIDGKAVETKRMVKTK